ncbi:MAG: DUF21 domain-containing protein [Phycisphaerales bacterium]|nr:DUF21 domain-containing protein [Phycisphaerales bacterium]
MIWLIALAVLSVIACGLLAGMETGVYTINRVRLAVRAGQGSKSARRLRDEILHSNRLLATLLVGVNFAHAGMSAVVTAMLVPLELGPLKETIINTALVMPIALLMGDAIPKELFRVFGNSWMYGCSWILVVLRVALQWTGLVPLVRILGESTTRLLGGRHDQGEPERKRILETLREGHRSGVIGDTHLEMADRVFGLSDRPVGECAVPWRKVVPVPATASVAEREWILRHWGCARFPVVVASAGRVSVVGIVSALDLLLEPSKSPSELARVALVIPPSTSVLEAARRMRLARTPMAIVGDGAQDGPVGIVTLKDVLEPVVGTSPAW